MKKLYVVFSILIVIFTFSIVNKTFQNDTFTAISVGNDILQNGVNDEETLTFHENLKNIKVRWAFDLSIAIVYNHFGFCGIYVYTLLLSIIIALLLFNMLLKRKSNIIVSFLFTILTMYGIKSFLTGRAQMYSCISILLEFFFLEKMLETNKKRYIFGVLFASILLLNFHGSNWSLCLVLYLPYIAEYFIQKLKIFENSKIIEKREVNIKLLMFSFILTFFSGLCSPLGFTPYTFIFKASMGVAKYFISELQSTSILHIFGLFLYVVLYLLLIYMFKEKIKNKLSDLFMFAGLLLMGCLVKKYVVYFIVVCCFLITNLISSIVDDTEDLNELTIKFSKSKIGIVLVVGVILIISAGNYINIYSQKYDGNCPVEAVNYLLENEDISQIRLYNHFNYGSYIAFRNIPIFLNSVAETFSSAFNDTDVLKDWYECAVSGKQSYKDIFEKYKITHVILYKDEFLNTYISQDENYENIYEDDEYVIYKKIAASL